MFKVGDEIHINDVGDELPVGTVTARSNSKDKITKLENGNWRSTHYGYDRGKFYFIYLRKILYLPEIATEAVVESKPKKSAGIIKVGNSVRISEQNDSLSVGTIAYAEGGNHIFKLDNGRWINQHGSRYNAIKLPCERQLKFLPEQVTTLAAFKAGDEIKLSKDGDKLTSGSIVRVGSYSPMFKLDDGCWTWIHAGSRNHGYSSAFTIERTIKYVP